jgi:uncharacterized membrane protein YhaH (DUF805 family)
MNPFTLAFVPGGRVGRLNYFLVHLGMMVVSMVVLVFMAVFMGFSFAIASGGGAENAGAAGMMLTLLAMFVLYVVYQYAAVVLMTKRLHDMGLSGWHAAWIYGLGLVCGAFLSVDNLMFSVMGLLLALVSFGVWLWLQFTPGEASVNEYGYADAVRSRRRSIASRMLVSVQPPAQ